MARIAQPKLDDHDSQHYRPHLLPPPAKSRKNSRSSDASVLDAMKKRNCAKGNGWLDRRADHRAYGSRGD
jgi:hypothetical protein